MYSAKARTDCLSRFQSDKSLACITSRSNYRCGSSTLGSRWRELISCDKNTEGRFRRYDEDGNEGEDIVTDLKGSVLHKVMRAFDSRGHNTELAYYFPDGTLDFKWLRKFDDSGNEIETMRWGKGGVFQFIETRVTKRVKLPSTLVTTSVVQWT